MTDTMPGADERRVRHQLRKLGVGPDAIEPPPIPPQPSVPPIPPQRPRDWLDEILDAPATPEPEAEPAAETAPPAPETAPPATETPAGKPRARKPKKPKTAQPKTQAPTRPAPGTPRSAWDGPADPKQSLADAFDRIPTRLKWLAARLLAAAAGWRLGMVGWATDTAAWYAQGHWVSPSAFVVYGLGAAAWALHRRTRSWAWPLAWAASIPASSLVVGVLLYGTDYQNLRIPW